jgi:hypothetical protein
MTAPLEVHYRRLLAAYPSEHRRAYEEEMITVLLAGAGPGQRRPSAGEAADLLWSGLLARSRHYAGRLREAARHYARRLREAAWRDAAAVAGLLGAFVLAAIAVRRLGAGVRTHLLFGEPMRAFGVDGGLLLDVAFRSAAWLAVVAAVLLGLRRTAVGLGIGAVLVEVGMIAAWSPVQYFRAVHMGWVPVLGLLTVALLILARSGRPAVVVLTRWGAALAAAGVAVAAVSDHLVWYVPYPGADAIGLFGLAVVLCALWRSPAPIRRRTIVLLMPVLALPVAQETMEEVVQIQLASALTPGIVAVQILFIVLVPLAALVLAGATLRWREDVVARKLAR